MLSPDVSSSLGNREMLGPSLPWLSFCLLHHSNNDVLAYLENFQETGLRGELRMVKTEEHTAMKPSEWMKVHDKSQDVLSAF